MAEWALKVGGFRAPLFLPPFESYRALLDKQLADLFIGLSSGLLMLLFDGSTHFWKDLKKPSKWRPASVGASFLRGICHLYSVIVRVAGVCHSLGIGFRFRT